MKKRKLKRFVVVGIYVVLLVAVTATTYFVSLTFQPTEKKEEKVDYVNDSVIEENLPVVQTDEVTFGKPYQSEGVTIAKYFYDYQGEKEQQERSIIYHENTYIQNSGMDFKADSIFDVISVLKGTILDVRDDELMGKTVEVKHDNGYISTYQSLSEIAVQKGDTVEQGQVIGKSGENTIDQEMGNHLHFELYKDGAIVDPAKYFDQKIETKES